MCTHGKLHVFKGFRAFVALLIYFVGVLWEFFRGGVKSVFYTARGPD